MASKISLFMTLLLSTSPGIPAGILDSTSMAYAQEMTNATEQVILHVDGMTCRRCVPPIQKALLEVPGVKKAHVSYKDEQAVVECERGRVSDELLVKAIEDQSSLFLTFTAKVMSRK